MRLITVLFTIIFSNQVLALGDKIEKVDFDVSMGIQNKPVYDFMFRHPKSKDYYHTFRKIYNENFNNFPQEKPRIPRKMHQLWVGGELPQFFHQYIETCKKTNPGWEYKLWTDKELAELSYNKDVTAKLTKRLDIKKDYLMHYILEKEGGVFLDVDYACFKPFDQLNDKYDAWFAIEPSGWWRKIPGISYSIIAAKPKHPIIAKTLKDIESYVLNVDYRRKHNIEYSHKYVVPEEIFAVVQLLEVFSIHEYCKSNNCSDIMVFPPTYFLPKINFDWMLDNIKKYSLLDKVKMHFGFDGYNVIYSEIQPETIAMNDFNAKKKINPLYYKEAFYKN